MNRIINCRYRLLLLITILGVIPCSADVLLTSSDEYEIKPDYSHILVNQEKSSNLLPENSYNDLNDALDYVLKMGTEELMTIYLAPGIYSFNGINCNNVSIQGLTSNPEEIIIRKSNSNALFRGVNITISNVTIDDCITGDRIYYKNCVIKSPYSNIETEDNNRTLYEKCIFNCYESALNGNAVYVNCDFQLNSSVPILYSAGRGTVFLGCKFSTNFDEVLYLSKEGPVVLVDCDFSGPCSALFWTPNLKITDRYYQSNVTLRGEDYLVSLDTLVTIDMSGQRLLDTYLYSYKNKSYYNILNLLGGTDRWDPMEQMKTISSAQSYLGNDLNNLPTELTIYPQSALIEHYGDTVCFNVIDLPILGWHLNDEDMELIVGKDNNTAYVTVKDIGKESISTSFLLEAYTESGLQTSAEVKIRVKKENVEEAATIQKRGIFRKRKKE